MKKVISFTVFLFILGAGYGANAAEQDAVGVTITKMYTYTQYGDGDISIDISTPATNCAGGFWLSSDDPGYYTTFSILLSAYRDKSNIQIGGEDTQKWPGSSIPYCRLKYVGLIP